MESVRTHSYSVSPMLTFVIFLVFSALTIAVGAIGTFAQAPLEQISIENELYDISWSLDGELIAVGMDEGVRIYAADLAEVAFLAGEIINSVAWHPDGTQLAAAGGFASSEGNIQIWDRNTSTNVFTLNTILENNHYQEFVVAWSPDSTKIASNGRDLDDSGSGLTTDTIQIWSTVNWTLLTTLDDRYMNSTRDLEWSPDSTFVGVGGRLYCDEQTPCERERIGPGYYIVDVTSGDTVRFIASLEQPSALAWSSNNLLAIDNPEFLVYDPTTGDLISALGGSAYKLEWSPNGKWIAQALGREGTVNIWHAATDTFVQSITSANRFIAFSWQPNGNALATVSEEGIIQIWDTSNLPDLSGTPTSTPFPSSTPVVPPTLMPNR
jgi:WD40 repeat protein